MMMVMFLNRIPCFINYDVLNVREGRISPARLEKSVGFK